jgi:hypothetical protein
MSRAIFAATRRAARHIADSRFSASGTRDVAVTLPRDFVVASLATASANNDKSPP